MNLGFRFFFNSILLGIGLAMDAFSVSLANGLNEPTMPKGKMVKVAGVFSGFQFLMPLIGWFCVTMLLELFSAFEPFIPWIALILLCFIGGKMLLEGIRGCDEAEDKCGVGLVAYTITHHTRQITIAHYNFVEALLASLLIGVVTFFICFMGLHIGKKAGTKLAGKAGIFGGAILIFIGIEIFVSSLL